MCNVECQCRCCICSWICNFLCKCRTIRLKICMLNIIIKTTYQHFSSTTLGLGVESTPDKLWGYTLSLLWLVQGQCLTCPIQYTPSVLAQHVGALPLSKSRQTLKCCATTIPMVCHFHLRLWTNNLSHVGRPSHLCVSLALHTWSPTMMSWHQTTYINEYTRIYM